MTENRFSFSLSDDQRICQWGCVTLSSITPVLSTPWKLSHLTADVLIAIAVRGSLLCSVLWFLISCCLVEHLKHEIPWLCLEILHLHTKILGPIQLSAFSDWNHKFVWSEFYFWACVNVSLRDEDKQNIGPYGFYLLYGLQIAPLIVPLCPFLRVKLCVKYSGRLFLAGGAIHCHYTEVPNLSQIINCIFFFCIIAVNSSAVVSIWSSFVFFGAEAALAWIISI